MLASKDGAVMSTDQNGLKLNATSVGQFGALARSRRLRLRRDRLGRAFTIESAGTFQIFRETVSSADTLEQPAVLVVGFRLRALRSNSLLHWFFQRGCILTTPFWSGFRGFRVKLWMVDSRSKNYLGIYEWAGTRDAQTYVDLLVRVLRPLSTTGPVWYQLYPYQELEPFLLDHAAAGLHEATAAHPAAA
jgi:hypothetical protein